MLLSWHACLRYWSSNLWGTNNVKVREFREEGSSDKTPEWQLLILWIDEQNKFTIQDSPGGTRSSDLHLLLLHCRLPFSTCIVSEPSYLWFSTAVAALPNSLESFFVCELFLTALLDPHLLLPHMDPFYLPETPLLNSWCCLVPRRQLQKKMFMCRFTAQV
jgi:hypothetical protein